MTKDAPAVHDTPRFSIVTAVYNVARYLDDFFASVAAQEFDLTEIEIIAVDDGSTDESLSVLEAWKDRYPGTVKVLHQENQGQGAARNLGLSVASGEWLTFTDPDDTLAPDYFAKVDAFIARNPDIAMVATARILHEEKENRYRDGHPLRKLFTEDKEVDLNRFPNYFHGSAPAAFFRRSLIEDAELRFDHRIQPNFEDGHFCCIYLLRSPSQAVGFLGSAHYYYRKRADQSSTLQTSRIKTTRYTHVPRYGYLDVLREGARRFGRAPEWAQTFILYELSWYFQDEDALAGVATAAHGEVGAEFVSILREISRELDDDVLQGFAVRNFKQAWREAFLYALRGITWHTPYVVMQRYLPEKKLLRIAYRFTGSQPTEEFLDRGVAQPPVTAKTRVLGYFGEQLVFERISWVNAGGTVRVRLDGRAVELRTSSPDAIRTTARPYQLQAMVPAPLKRRKRSRISRETRRADRIRRLATSIPARLLFRRAWVVMDRVNNSDDNGERLFEYLRQSRRDINAWFVVQKDTPDWHRMRRAGHRRVIAYGSLAWKILMLNADHLISSHADVAVWRPREIAALGPIRYRFTFLQHGVIKDDISRWLNGKEFDLFVTTTKAEHESIVGELSPYRATKVETQRVGLARFDRLTRLANEADRKPRNLVLVAPTWRDHLQLPLAPGAVVRELRPDIAESDYVRNWLGFLSHPTLQALAADGHRIGFLPHPNLQPLLERLELPSWVEPLTFDDDVQKLFASCAVMVTDYSSTAFNAAVANRPLVYFQFDAEDVAAGAHLGRAGYFSYADDGFGPVAQDIDAAVTAVDDIVRRGGRPAPEYQARIDAAFDLRDGQNCARTVRAIESLTTRAPMRFTD